MWTSTCSVAPISCQLITYSSKTSTANPTNIIPPSPSYQIYYCAKRINVARQVIDQEKRKMRVNYIHNTLIFKEKQQ